MASTAVLENSLQHRYDTPSTALHRVLAEAAYFPRVSDNKTAALWKPTRYALRWPYMQINRRGFTSWLIFDCDHSDIYLWEKVGLPPPNLIVSSNKDGKINSFHVLYAITPICTTANARSHPIRYMKAIYGEMARLLKADPDYHGGPVCKTPGHPWWRTTELHSHEYSLGELHEYFDIPFEKPQFSKGPELTSLTHSRALTLFEQLRFFAYSVVNNEREQGSFNSFTQRLTHYAEQINDFERRGFRDFKTGTRKGNLPASALRYTVRSVSRWTWDHYTGSGRKNRGAMRLDQALPLPERQRLSAERTHVERTKKTADRVRAACAVLRASGREMTLAAIGKIAGITRQTVANYKHLIKEPKSHLVSTVRTPRGAGEAPQDVRFGAHQIAPAFGPFRNLETYLQKLPLVSGCSAFDTS
jgi:hypothetical protein